MGAMRCRVKDIDSIGSFLEIGLLESSDMNRDSFYIKLDIRNASNLQEIQLYLHRIVSALDATNTNNFIIRFVFNGKFGGKENLLKICTNFNRKHLAAILERRNGRTELIVSNKSCN